MRHSRLAEKEEKAKQGSKERMRLYRRKIKVLEVKEKDTARKMLRKSHKMCHVRYAFFYSV